MPETRSGQSYNSMDQASHNAGPSNPETEPTQTPTNFQQQLDQLSQTLGSILHRLEVIQEHSTAGVGRDTDVEHRVPRQRDGIGDHEDEREVQLGGGRRYAHRAAPVQFRRPDVRQEPLDELTKRMKVEVSDFLGRLNPDAFQDWITALEDYFDWFSVPEERKVRFVKLKLKGPARAWWSSVEEQLRRTHQAPITDWVEMRDRLESKYLPINYDQLIYEDMLQWKQEPKASVDQYTERFHELSVRSKAVETETQSLARYLNGLKVDLRKDMLTARVYNVEEAYQLALQLEKQANVSSNRRYQLADFGGSRPTTVFKQKLTEETVKSDPARDVRGKVSEGPQCYKCKDEAEPSESPSTSEFAKQEEEEEILKAVDLPICVINRVLTERKQPLAPESNDWKRTNIFHTRVAHGNKALNVIIDNGSGMNVISKAVVERLELPQHPHPTPYRFDFVIRHKAGRENQVADALSRRPHILTIFHSNAIGFEAMKKQYATDDDFKVAWSSLQENMVTAPSSFAIKDGTPLEVSPLPLPTRVSEAGMDFSSYITTLHDDIRKRIATNTEEYAAHANLRRKNVQFNVGDQVLIRLRPERFPPGSFTKLHARRAGPFPILKKLGSNAYLIDLPVEYSFSPIFNIEDLTAYKGLEDHEQNAQMDSAPRIPVTPSNRDSVDAIIDHQFVSTRRGGYYKFLVRWATKPISEAVWLQAPEIQRLCPELFRQYTQINLPESSFNGGGN
ncbi:hypothetical protein LWI29_003545 [Acer saccharum]|uniref:Chromo domain-containing protein n=1 Tax=Acer saccharum TaxID=4024 RepID=A0AA39VL01_ACESA|nr:hypothetical protein LWI29_003545 [Acer saccharum]